MAWKSGCDAMASHPGSTRHPTLYGIAGSHPGLLDFAVERFVHFGQERRSRRRTIEMDPPSPRG
jgi:hypothetical protein